MSDMPPTLAERKRVIEQEAAHAVLSGMSSQSMLLAVMAHIEARNDINPKQLETVSNLLGRRAWRMQR